MPRLRHLISGLVLTAVVAASALSGPATAQTPPPSPYLETFGLETDNPAPYPASARMGVLVHNRDQYAWNTAEPMEAEHGPACQAPPATHHLSGDYADAVFGCKDHLMTAINASGYGVIYLTPPAEMDLSTGEAVLRFDASTHRSSTRDWWDLWVTPFEDMQAAPLDNWLPDLQGPPKRGLHVRMDQFGNGSGFRVERVDNHAATDLGVCTSCFYESVLTPSASRRDTFELRVSATHVKLWMPQYGLVWIDKDLTTPLGWSKGVVQIGHHSYNPTKVCVDEHRPLEQCLPNTWHWDNLSVSPSSPLTIIPARERITWTGAPNYTFAEPAGPDAYLIAHLLAETAEYSLNGGATWATMTQQTTALNDGGHFRTYRQPIPAGTTAVRLRGSNTWAGQWVGNHAAIYSQTPRGVAPTPTLLPPTNTPFPTDTPTPIPATSTTGPTSTPFPTSTNTAVPPATVTPTPEVSATPTFQPNATSTPSCQVQVTLGGTPGPLQDCQ